MQIWSSLNFQISSIVKIFYYCIIYFMIGCLSSVQDTFAIDFTHARGTRAEKFGLLNIPVVNTVSFGKNSIRSKAINSWNKIQSSMPSKLVSLDYSHLKNYLKKNFIASYINPPWSTDFANILPHGLFCFCSLYVCAVLCVLYCSLYMSKGGHILISAIAFRYGLPSIVLFSYLFSLFNL